MYFSTLLGCGWCSLVGLDWVQQTLDKVHDIRQNLLIAQSRQKALVFPRLKASFVLAPQGSLARGTTLDLHSVIIARIGALAYRRNCQSMAGVHQCFMFMCSENI